LIIKKFFLFFKVFVIEKFKKANHLPPAAEYLIPVYYYKSASFGKGAVSFELPF